MHSGIKREFYCYFGKSGILSRLSRITILSCEYAQQIYINIYKIKNYIYGNKTFFYKY